MGNPTEILGIVLPNDSILFLSSVAVHIVAGMTCVVAGLLSFTLRKVHSLHPKIGSFYYLGTLVILVTSIALAIIRWPNDNHLVVFGAVSFLSVYVARRARRKNWKFWARWHLVGMSFSYIVMLTAFYVDNGPNLPLWKLLPPVYFWILPGLVGIPLVVFGFFKNPLTRPKGRSQTTKR